LPPVKPDDGGEVLKLLGGEVENLAIDLPVNVPSIDHQDIAFGIQGNVTLIPDPSPRGRREGRMGGDLL